jgi:hypothetical protein
MSPYLRPDADALVGNFANELGATSNLYESIDESSPSDSDYVISPADPSQEPYVCELSSVDDPEVGTGHIIRYRYQKNLASGDQVDMTAELRESYVSEASKGSLIKSWTHTDIGSSAVTAEQTLSTTEANSITSYSSLSLRFVFNAP